MTTVHLIFLVFAFVFGVIATVFTDAVGPGGGFPRFHFGWAALTFLILSLFL